MQASKKHSFLRRSPLAYVVVPLAFVLVSTALVFIVGHTLNIAINLLGAYVHTNRLQFVEFFGKFYEGGGEAFAPFAAHTKYYQFSEVK